ncbi:phosphoserine phosphatase [Ditylenchus destructor]|nr:phosphoserine phosphatase [Ditylenchus destructor]
MGTNNDPQATKIKKVMFKKITSLIMIGDGATDAEACPPADAFIGFGGNQVRETVQKLADWYVYDFETLLKEPNSSENEAI